MIRKRKLLARQCVDARCHLLGLGAIIHENERCMRRAHVLQDERRDRRPNRGADVREVVDR